MPRDGVGAAPGPSPPAPGEDPEGGCGRAGQLGRRDGSGRSGQVFLTVELQAVEEHDSETWTDVQGPRPAPGHARVENVPALWAACRGWGALGAQSPEEDRGCTPRKEDLLALPHPHLVPGWLCPPLPHPDLWTCGPLDWPEERKAGGRGWSAWPSSSLAALAAGCIPLCPWLPQGPSAVPLPRAQAR